MRENPASPNFDLAALLAKLPVEDRERFVDGAVVAVAVAQAQRPSGQLPGQAGRARHQHVIADAGPVARDPT